MTLPASHEYMNAVIDSDGSEILTSEDQKQVVQASEIYKVYLCQEIIETIQFAMVDFAHYVRNKEIMCSV